MIVSAGGVRPEPGPWGRVGLDLDVRRCQELAPFVLPPYSLNAKIFKLNVTQPQHLNKHVRMTKCQALRAKSYGQATDIKGEAAYTSYVYWSRHVWSASSISEPVHRGYSCT